MRVLLALPLIALLSVVAFADASAPSRAQEAPTTEHVPGEVILNLEPGTSVSSLGIAASIVRDTSANGSFVTVAVTPGREQQMIDDFADRPGIAAAELNTLKQPMFAPNDPDYPLQWNMRMIGAEQAWETTRGAGITVAIVDTGIAFEDYRDFAKAPQLRHVRFVTPYDATNGTNHPNDENGHGTHVTGTVAQDFDDGIGLAGLAPDVAIMPVRVCQPYGCASDDMAEGVEWAVDHGADVINMSLGGSTITSAERAALAYAESQGVVVVASAGNGGGDFVGDNRLLYPAAVETVVAVGAVDPSYERVAYSNYGTGEGDDGLLIMAPGGNLHVDKNQDGNPDGVLQNTYKHSCEGGTVDYRVFTECWYHGTSMAAPHVTGTVALLRSFFPGLSAKQVRSVLACTAQDIGPAGVDTEYGVGLVRADLALSDPDLDGTPGCVEEGASVFVAARGGTVSPQSEITLGVDAAVQGGAIGGYHIEVSYNANITTAEDCVPLHGGTCYRENNKVIFDAHDTIPLQDGFKIGSITFKSKGETTLGSFLHVTAQASAYFGHDPPPDVTTQDAFLLVTEVPNTVSGDSNCDGDVSVVDAGLTLSGAGSLTGGFCEEYADVNCSGGIEPLDVLATLSFLADIAVTLPAGCPTIGTTGNETPTPTPAPTEAVTVSPTPAPTEAVTVSPTPEPSPSPSPVDD